MEKHPHKTENPLLKECLFTALIKLMDQKDFKDIKISEIAQKAGVSRMTYYRTYDSKEDILIQYFEDQSRAAQAQIAENSTDALSFFTLYFAFFKEQAHLMQYLYKAELLKDVLLRFTDFVSDFYNHSTLHQLEPEHRSYEVSFIAGGLFLLLLHWIERGLVETPEEMARMTIRMLHLSVPDPMV